MKRSDILKRLSALHIALEIVSLFYVHQSNASSLWCMTDVVMNYSWWSSLQLPSELNFISMTIVTFISWIHISYVHLPK